MLMPKDVFKYHPLWECFRIEMENKKIEEEFENFKKEVKNVK